MSNYSVDTIIQKANDIAELLHKTEEVALFKLAEEQLKDNHKVHSLIEDIKDLQKQAVNLKHLEKTSAYQKTEERLNELQREFDQLPIIQDYRRSQYEANELLQMVTSTISNTVNDNLEKN